jgi:uncharacterized membrane protein YjgN (DUF898 family)
MSDEALPIAPHASTPTATPGQLYEFDGGAATFFGTAILAFLITVFTLGIYAFWWIPRMTKWRVENVEWAEPA